MRVFFLLIRQRPKPPKISNENHSQLIIEIFFSHFSFNWNEIGARTLFWNGLPIDKNKNTHYKRKCKTFQMNKWQCALKYKSISKQRKEEKKNNRTNEIGYTGRSHFISSYVWIAVGAFVCYGANVIIVIINWTVDTEGTNIQQWIQCCHFWSSNWQLSLSTSLEFVLIMFFSSIGWYVSCRNFACKNMFSKDLVSWKYFLYHMNIRTHIFFWLHENYIGNDED